MEILNLLIHTSDGHEITNPEAANYSRLAELGPNLREGAIWAKPAFRVVQ
jgi:hypothetical protein